MATFNVKTKNVNAIKYSGGPGVSAAGTIPPGTILTIGATSTSYFKISEGANRNMWISSKDCTPVSSVDVSKTSPVSTTSTSKNGTGTIGTPIKNNITEKDETLDNTSVITNKINMIMNNQGKDLKNLGANASMRLFGMPHQLLEYNDYRVNTSSDIGRMFMETFVLDAPIIYVKPGTTNFLPGMSVEDKESYLAMFADIAKGDEIKSKLADQIKQLMNGDDLRYFEFKQKYAEYMGNVNMLCRICSVFMDLHNVRVPWHGGNITFGSYDWNEYTYKNKDFSSVISEPSGNLWGDVMKAFVNWADVMADDGSAYIKFYVDATASFSEDASNSTTQSVLNSFTDQMSEVGKELAFVSGVSGTSINDALNEFNGGIDNAMQQVASGDGPISSLFRRLTGVGSQLLAGSNFLSPEIWNDSSYSKNYSFTINLNTPYGNPLSRYINIMVPLMHILGFTLPTQTSANTYATPNIVQLFAPGWFSCDMGIVDSIGIDKGGSGDAWASDGMPNEMKISISVKDLYSNLALPDGYSISKFFNNTGLLNFLMVNCGVDITNTGLSDKIAVFENLFSNTINGLVGETVNGIWYGIQDTIKRVTSLYRG